MAMSAQDKLFRALGSASQSGKVIDVSTLKDNGTGARLVNAPPINYRGAKKGIEGLNIISNNYENYKLATDILGPEYDIFADVYFDEFVTPRAPVRAKSSSPVRSRNPSPTRARSRSPVPVRTRSPARSPPRNHVIGTRAQSPVRSRSPQQFDIRSNVRNY